MALSHVIWASLIHMNRRTEKCRVFDGTSSRWLCYLWIAFIAASLSIHIDLLNRHLLRLEILMKHFSGGLYFPWSNQKSHTFFCRKEQSGEKKNEKRGWKANQWCLKSWLPAESFIEDTIWGHTDRCALRWVTRAAKHVFCPSN